MQDYSHRETMIISYDYENVELYRHKVGGGVYFYNHTVPHCVSISYVGLGVKRNCSILRAGGGVPRRPPGFMS